MCFKMASEMEPIEKKTDEIWPLNERKLQKQLRSSGLEYISRSGKVIPAKSQPESLCQCPQHCDEKVPAEVRLKLFTEFYKLGDHQLQNDFLMAHIKTRAVQRRSLDLKVPGRNKRRVSCKYQIPLLFNSSPPITPGPSPPGVKLVEVCQKAYMNVFAITEKRVRLQREKLIAEVGGRPLITPPRRQIKVGQIGEVGLWRDAPVSPSNVRQTREYEHSRMGPLQQALTTSRLHHEVTITPKQPEITLSAKQYHDIDLVDSFFSNQLWKPEYINMAT
ncbi:uncharacterized protein [Anabrus simplex]|uniref:uncharacterized protein n=1 Tax=Anabrus simplex TaxID=316456 RepID=UPI0034DCD696